MILTNGCFRIRVRDGLFFAETKCFWWWMSVDTINGMGTASQLVFKDPMHAEYWLRFGKLFQPVDVYRP